MSRVRDNRTVCSVLLVELVRLVRLVWERKTLNKNNKR